MRLCINCSDVVSSGICQSGMYWNHARPLKSFQCHFCLFRSTVCPGFQTSFQIRNDCGESEQSDSVGKRELE